jgi:hypothetical protein
MLDLFIILAFTSLNSVITTLAGYSGDISYPFSTQYYWQD